MEIGMGFWASKILLTAISLELFTHLGDGELSGLEIQKKLELHERSLYDFLDSLVALGFLKRSGIKHTSLYRNTEETSCFLDKNKESYAGGMLEMANKRLYPFWNNLEECLISGLPQNETKAGGRPIFEHLYSDSSKLTGFLSAMGSIQMENFRLLSRAFNFHKYNKLCDLGGAGGFLSIQVALSNSHMKCISYDLLPVAALALENVTSRGLQNQITIQSGDFFKDEIPEVDVITMGNILHDWGLKEKQLLIKRAFDAIQTGGALIVIENIIDDERNKNAFGLMMSLNMMIETTDGFDFSFSDFNTWAVEAGFRETYIIPLSGPSSAAIAIK